MGLWVTFVFPLLLFLVFYDFPPVGLWACVICVIKITFWRFKKLWRTLSLRMFNLDFFLQVVLKEKQNQKKHLLLWPPLFPVFPFGTAKMTLGLRWNHVILHNPRVRQTWVWIPSLLTAWLTVWPRQVTRSLCFLLPKKEITSIWKEDLAWRAVTLAWHAENAKLYQWLARMKWMTSSLHNWQETTAGARKKGLQWVFLSTHIPTHVPGLLHLTAAAADEPSGINDQFLPGAVAHAKGCLTFWSSSQISFSTLLSSLL